MKSYLKAKLKKNFLTRDPNDYYAQVILNGKYGVSEILDELLKDNAEISKKAAIELINTFNSKVVELLVSGNQVNTGLVSLSPIIKGSFVKRNWNALVNRVDVGVSNGFELNKALIDTNIQIVEDQGEVVENINQIQRLSEAESLTGNGEIHHSTVKPAQEPPCGTAFRNWLCTS